MTPTESEETLLRSQNEKARRMHPVRRAGLARAWLLPTVCCVFLTETTVHSQTITLEPGEFYFRHDGTPSFPLGTNPVGWQTTQFDTLLAYASVNEHIVRIHIQNGRRHHPAVAGQVDPLWAGFWDGVFTTAEQNGLYVLPVFGVWSVWNTTAAWDDNPYNDANGGPASDPAALLTNSPTRDLWLGWLDSLVVRWEGRQNILAWEVFSELDLISGSTDSAAVDFVEAAAAVIRAADSQGRPVTASLAGVNDWAALSNSSIEFIQVHPYANATGDLDDLILSVVLQRRTQYGKPVFIGESGLDSRRPIEFNTLTLSPQAPVGINHSIWASAVSGAMVGRMLWFEDGYDQFQVYVDSTRLDLRSQYKDASAPVARFVAGVDYSDFESIDVVSGNDLTGAALGNAVIVLAWVRDVQSAAPDWPSRSLSGQSVTVAVPGQSDDLLVTFYDTMTGEVLQSESPTREANGDVDVALPDFSGSIAFQIHPRQPADFDGDGQVGFGDFLVFAASFGESLGDDGYVAAYDLDGNDAIDFPDFIRFAAAFGS